MNKPGRPGKGSVYKGVDPGGQKEIRGSRYAETTRSEQSNVVKQASEPPQKTTDGRVNLGQSMVFKGELTVSENLNIAGQVEGKIVLRQHVLTVGPTGKVKGEISAKAVIVLGQVRGGPRFSDRLLRWSPDPTGGIWNATKETELPG